MYYTDDPVADAERHYAEQIDPDEQERQEGQKGDRDRDTQLDLENE